MNEIIMQTEAYQLLLRKLVEVQELLEGKLKENQIEKLLTVKEAAKQLRVSEKTIRNYIDTGKIKAIDYNAGTPLRGNYRIKESEIKKQYK